jgi:hypothetical protein
LILKNDGAWSFLEVNTSPGMTGHSLVPMAAKEVGIPFPSLCVRDPARRSHVDSRDSSNVCAVVPRLWRRRCLAWGAVARGRVRQPAFALHRVVVDGNRAVIRAHLRIPNPRELRGTFFTLTRDARACAAACAGQERRAAPAMADRLEVTISPARAASLAR